MSSKRECKCIPEASNKGKKKKVVKNADKATPFRWCLEVDNALEINCPLLREVLRRWVPQGEYIRVGSLFEKKPITLRDIINKIKNLVVSDDDVDNAYNLENLSDYNWAESVHSFLISALNRGCKVVREKINTRSLNLARSIVVVQVWAARRLGLEDVEGEVQFPRFLRWPSVKIRTPNFESTFEKNKIGFGWALTAEEKNNPIEQNVVHIEDQYNVQNDGIQGVSHSKQQVDLEEKFEKHERIILDMKEQIKKMRDEFFDAPELDSYAGKGNDVNEEEGCPSEQRKCDEGQGCPSHWKESPQPHQCEEDDLNDKPKSNHNGDDKAIKPNTEGQSNTLFIDKAKLYKDVTAVGCARTIYVHVNGEILRSDECPCFRPRGWIDNMSIMFAAYEFMYKQKRLTGKISRVIFNPFYTLLAPVIYAEHWWCYAFNCQTKEFFVLDSLAHKCRRRKQIDSHVVQNVEHLFWLLLNDKKQLKPTYEVHIEDVPEQPNLHDCGIMVLKYLEI
ncbi:Ulp1 protease family [Vigna unguiculata]|uniref:Ulp1 protease family n=1 Tax=Vigna unguiculata TaxID=3917 RepID=A0A4D6NF23_VIGUN|nr:Ulp1 protease family [Vigna unguiculata]